MSPKCKVSFFFLFKLFTKSSWKSERQLPLQGLKSIKTTTEQLKQSERKGKGNNVQHLAFGFIHRFSQSSSWNWKQTILANTASQYTGRGLSTSCQQRRSVQSDCGAHSRSLMLWPLSSHHPFQDIKQPTYRGPPTWLPFLPSKVASASIIYWATCRGPKAETELESLHHQGVDDAGQCFLLLTTPSLAAPCHPFRDNLASTFPPTSA